MTSGFSKDGLPDLGSAIQAFEEEQAKLTEFQRKLAETTTVVESRNHMVTVTLDGNGELSELKFNTTAYRSMAPAQLSAAITEVLQQARQESLETMQKLMGRSPVPGYELSDLTSGQADLAEVLGKIMEPSLNLVSELEGNADHEADGKTPESPQTARHDDEDDGWERP
ncbi:YbaB/EbfC family nucleoid-associated protein [Saccharopolyspora gloriosae]|uniref:YbaB/EbfC family nucleoid-associated protein n=1 Tax=Saccharopolyspora gloriosae TaxID=455344 RepID=UPI001FB6F547|nr:YbaB/EbfC family nucleoid-associated protein [Saccharopolyspora gloriosae]